MFDLFIESARYRYKNRYRADGVDNGEKEDENFAVLYQAALEL